MYFAQRMRSRQRKHDMPNYTLAEFKEWCLSQAVFHRLFDEWKASGYKVMLSPSTDRIDDKKPYTFDNIVITTWAENNRKGWIGKVRAVVQFKDGKVIAKYPSVAEASKETGVSKPSISNCCSKPQRFKTAGGFVWKYNL